ncbi:MAG: tetraacyldisaccharide 4'-kinase [Bryobacteraceae bacterium]
MRANLIFVLYWSLQLAGFPFLLLYLCSRVARNRRYLRALGERFGFLPRHLLPTAPGAIWLHAVSVGEALASIPLLRRLRCSLPGVPVYVSTTTLAGRAVCEEKLAGLADGVFFAPVDYRFAVRRVLRRLRPALLIVAETEIWPNLFREARRHGARLLLVNARISDRALPRYLRLRWFFRPVLALADLILAQDALAASRYRSLGAENVEIAGNLKYDFDPDATKIPPDIQQFLDSLQPSPVWIAASTMPPAAPGDPDEDSTVLDAFLSLAPRFPRLLLILAPRRPESFPAAAEKLAARGIPFLRRSQLPASNTLPLPGVLLLDSIGELASLFRAASAVFMGGTFPRRGGHNILEPAAFGVPVLAGPHMENFAEIAAEFCENQALISLSSPQELPSALERLFLDPQLRSETGARAARLASTRRGAAARAAEAATVLHDLGLPRPPSLHPLSRLWLAGMALHRALVRPKALERPVISIGNLAMGGAGKTPLVRWLARELAARGIRPAVLTRGYRRASTRPVAALPGESLPVELTGDEPQLLLRDGCAAVAIGADRLAASRLLIDQRAFRPDVFLLDDGFQHWKISRSLDIVLIDAIDPFRGGVFPAGRLREPFSALARAGAVVVTRAENGRNYSGILQEIRKYNAECPVFFARFYAEKPDIPAEAPVAALCGIGQPESFRRTLASLGIRPACFRAFPDHHRYSEADLRPLLDRFPVLLTTEKDIFNLPPALRSSPAIRPVPVRLEIDQPEPLLALVLSRLSAAPGSSGS